MSYLDVPRLHFAGSFIAKPSTINNTPTNYDPATLNTTGLVQAWNPNGNHDWEFLDCTVRTAVGGDGTVWNSGNPEAIIGAGVESRGQPPHNAKLVDLDTEQQMVSQIWGLRINVAISATEYFVGNFRVMSFDDIWARVPDGQQDWMFSAYYQSVLDDVAWGAITSPFLQELQSVSPNQLSIKFVVDAYQDLYYMKNFNQGRIVGTIGPAYDTEPPNFLIGRQLRPAGQGTLNYGYARVDATRWKLLVDLGNSIPTQSNKSTTPPSQSETAPPVDVGTLAVAFIPPNGKPDILGEYDYSLDAYLATAGIQEYDLTEDQLGACANMPLGVVQTKPPKGSKEAAGTMLQESPTGAYINCTQPVIRMNPGEVCTVELMAMLFGVPAANQFIVLNFNNSAMQGQQPAIPPAPSYWTVGVPASALSFPQSVLTRSDGRATFELAASDPGNPRQVIDGQVYGIGYSWSQDNLRDFPSDSNNFVSVLVFDSFNKEPTWENLQPFLMQYAVLYPYMDSIFVLSDPEVYSQNIAAFKKVLSLPITDPGYMPVTRDMSSDKRKALLAWLDKGAPLS